MLPPYFCRTLYFFGRKAGLTLMHSLGDRALLSALSSEHALACVGNWKWKHIYISPIFQNGRKGICPYFPNLEILGNYSFFPTFLTLPLLHKYSSSNSFNLERIVLSVTSKYSHKSSMVATPSWSLQISNALSNSSFLESGV